MPERGDGHKPEEGTEEDWREELKPTKEDLEREELEAKYNPARARGRAGKKAHRTYSRYGASRGSSRRYMERNA